MFKRKNCFFITLCLIILLLCVKGCDSLPLHLPKVKDGKPYGITEGLFRHQWWNYYERALSFADGGFFEDAESDLREAIRQRKDDEWRVRTYGMHFIDYFPHCELGVIKYRQGALEASVRELTTALKTAKNAKAEYYLDLARERLIKRKKSDKAPPEIIIKSPQAGHLIRDFSIEIRGMARDDTFVRQITVNRKKIRTDVSAQEIPFYMEVPVSPGKNSIPVTVTDLTGKKTQTEVVVYVDRTGPLISLDTAFEDDPGSGAIVLKGYAYDDSGLAEVTVNDRKLTYNGEKKVRIQEKIQLRSGQTELDIRVRDMPGNVTSAKTGLSEGSKVAGNLLAENAAFEKTARSDRPVRILALATPPVITLHNEMTERTTYLDHAVMDGKVTGQLEYLSVKKCVILDDAETCIPVDEKQFPEDSGNKFFFNYIIKLEKNEKAVTVIDIKAKSTEGIAADRHIRIRWKEHKARQLGSRLKIAVSDLSRSKKVSDDNFEALLVGAMLARGRFSRAEHLRLNMRLKQGWTEKEGCGNAKDAGFHCILFGHIKKGADDSMHINVRLKDTGDEEYLFKNVDVYGYSSKLLSQVMSYKLADELPLIDGIVEAKPRDDWITVNFGGENKVKKGMDIIIYELSEITPGFKDTNELGEAEIRVVQKEVSLAHLIKPTEKEEKGKIQPEHNVITR